jgi:hypothetical protein
MIIGVSGYSGSGKDLVGTMIQFLASRNTTKVSLEDILDFPINHEYWLEEQSGWEIKKWAGKLKTIASMLTGIPVEKFEDQQFKKTDLGPEWDMTVRDFLQKLGTDAVRDGLHSNAWVNALMSDYTSESKWVITDTRFPNEAEAIRKKDGIMIRVERSGVKPINNHPSETGLDDYTFDHVIKNNGSIEDLLLKVKSILQFHKIM